MAFIRALHRHHQSLNLFYTQYFYTNPRNTATSLSHESRSLSSLSRSDDASVSAQTESGIDTASVGSSNLKSKTLKPLHILFKEAVGLSKPYNESEADIENSTSELSKTFQELQIEVRNLEKNKRKNLDSENSISEIESAEDDFEKPTSLSDVFKGRTGHKMIKSNKESESKKIEVVVEPIVYKELSSDMALLAKHLHNQGYFVNANCVSKTFDAMCFENEYSRQYLKHAAVKFGEDNREIAKWLSGNDLKAVAQFGCPSLTKRNVFAAKTLRKFFKIQENTICSKCALKPSCNYANQNIWNRNVNTLDLPLVMRVISVYGLGDGAPELVLSDDGKACVGRLIKEIIRLSETVKESHS